MRTKRVIKTSNNAVVLQSGGPTAVINASLIGIAKTWQEYDGKLFGAVNGVEGLLQKRFTLLYPRDDFQKVISIHDSPSAALGSSRHSLKHKSGALKEDEISPILETLGRLNVGYVFLIGGEDSRENAHSLSVYAKRAGSEICIIHIPKTIDNDLTLTHHSPGYLSAAQFVVHAVAGIDLDNRAIPGVAIDVVMGRNAGWLAASAFLARNCVASISPTNGHCYEKTVAEQSAGPHLIYLPETEFEVERFLTDVQIIMGKYNRAHVVVSEGIGEHKSVKDYIEKIHGAKFLKELCGVDSFGHAQLSGNGILGTLLCHMVKNGLGIKRVRVNTFDYLQRSFPMFSEADISDAFKVGEYAVKCARCGIKQATVTLGSSKSLQYSAKISHADLSLTFEEGQPRIKTFPKNLIIDGNNISDEFIQYLGLGKNTELPTISIPMFRVLDFQQIAN